MTQTTKAQHTPGPWHVSSDTINGPDGSLVAGIPHPYDLPKREANSRLIAAAPALLEAAKLGLTLVEPLLSTTTHKSWRGALDVIRTAIRQAQGEVKP